MLRATGPGEVTPDGCAVEVYRRLPPAGEAELVHAFAPPGAAVLELGAGMGRIARPLATLGHRVVAVDESATMLALVEPPVIPVNSRIQGLSLRARFAAVLLASHLLNTPDAADRRALLAAAARHLAADGVLVTQWHPPEWYERLETGGKYDGAFGPVESALEVLRLGERQMDAVVRYRVLEGGDDLRWEQWFSAARLDVADLDAELSVAGLRRDAWMTPDRAWFTARGQVTTGANDGSGECQD